MRRDADDGDRQALVEVFAELAEAHGRLEIAVGGGDDLHVDPARRGGADAAHDLVSMTLRNFACSAGEMWPISSRKIAPPSAVSKRPARAVLASVKAPFS